MPFGQFFFVVFAAYALSAAFFLIRGQSRRLRTIGLVVLVPAVLACPLMIDPEAPVLRLLAGVTLVFFVTKSWDLYRRAPFFARVPLRTWLAFLMNHCLNVPRDCRDFTTPLPFHRRLREFNLRMATLIVTTLVAAAIWSYDGSAAGFWIEHFVKAPVALLWIKAGFEIYSAGWQLAGARIIPFSPNTLRSQTPAQFWRRWHRSAYPWFLHDIAEPLRRIGPAFVPVMAVFVVSGLMHEYAFAVLPAGRFSGYMMAFFLVQGVAVVATHRLSPAGPWRIVGVFATFAFIVFTSVWFIVPVNEFVRFYDNPIPRWVLPW